MSEGGRQRLYLPFLDGVRGVAALYVVVHHIWQFAIASPTAPSPGWFRIFTVFKYGDYGVAVFIVLSGYCLMLPVAARQRAAPSDAFDANWYRGFAERRARRILPGYLAVLGASILLVALTGQLREPTGTPWDITLPNLTVGSIGAHLFAVHNWSAAWQFSLNPPLWSVALELQIYVVFAAALMPLARRVGTGATAIVALIASLPLVWAGYGFAHPWMVALFAMGMIGAEITTSGRQGTRLDGTAMALVALAVVGVTVIGGRVMRGEAQTMVGELTVGAATAVWIVVLASPGRSSSAPKMVRRLLETPAGRWIGEISYSIYLVHYPIVAVFAIVVVGPIGVGVPASFGLIALLASLPIVGAAVVSYRFVERPFLRRRVPQESVKSA